ncbi:MAG: RsmG family class I SAM-dependent methyltransferase [Syntrophorhabdales bacterium]
MERLQDLIEEGLTHFNIDHDAKSVGHLVSYIGELERWNRTMNLVGLKDSRRIVGELVYDAFFLHTRVAGERSLLDLGSGAGVIAIPLSILDPTMRVISVDKGLKKVLFQRHARRLLGLAGLEIIHGRMEDVAPLGVRTLVAKAFGPARVILAEGRRHLGEGGRAFIVKGFVYKKVS